MIIVRLISGLGNQLFQYAIGRQLSLMHNVPLKLDKTFYDAQNLRSYKLHNYKINAEIATQKEINEFIIPNTSNKFKYRLYRKVINKLGMPSRKQLFVEKTWWVYQPELFDAKPDVYLDGYWQHYKYFENIHPLVIQELQLKEVLDDDNRALSNIMLNDSHSVAVHIRRGDYVTDKDANGLMGVLPLEYYYKAIQYIRDAISTPTFYIFSDDLAWAKQNLITDAKLEFVSAQQDFVDLALMQSCSHQIIANSSYSWWGAFLNANVNKIVIAPAKWVLPDEINQRIHLQHPSWITI